MKQNNSKKAIDTLIMGFALFAVFFGADNIIFPPYLGHSTGLNWFESMMGFLTADPVLPITGFIAASFLGGEPDALVRRLGSKFSLVLTFIVIMLIGPLLAIPRTAATVHEIAIQPFFNEVPIAITSLLFFIVTFVLIFNQGKVVEIIGKYLTPVLIIILSGIIIKTIIDPIGEIAPIIVSSPFSVGFKEGYQTMDALATGLMASIIFKDMLNRGYTDKGEQRQLILGVGLIAGILLAFVYGGLTYVGATASSVIPNDISRVNLLTETANATLGGMGNIAIGLCVMLACLTTAIGLTAIAGDFLSEDIFKNKINYKIIIGICILISFIISILGTEQIIEVAGPILSIIYPVFIVAIMMSLFDRHIKYDLTYVGAICFTLITSILSVLSELVPFTALQAILQHLPFAQMDMPWILPAVFGGVLFTLVVAATTNQDNVNDPSFTPLENES